MRVNPGSTDVSVYFYIVQDASNTSPGEPVTGLLFSDIETGGSAAYVRQGAAKVDLTLITLASASAAHADGGFILVDDTIMPGVYRCDYADATFAAGVDEVTLQIVVASAKNAVASPIFVDLNTETSTALVSIKLDHLIAVADGDDPVDGSIMAHLASTTEDWSTFVPSTDALQALRDRGDAAWTTGAGGSNPFVLQNTTITGLASQTTFNLTAGSADDGAYENMLAIVEDQSTATQKAIGVIATYTGSTKTIVLREDPGIFTMADGDTIDVVVVSPDILDILADVGSITAVGAAIHVTAIASPGGFVLTTGSEVNTEDATVALDGTKHELSDAAGTLDGLYKFAIGGDAAPVSVTFTGNFNSNNDTFDIFGNTGTDGTPVWVQIGLIAGSNSSVNTVHTLTMFNNMIVTDVAGEVQVRVQATGLTSSSFDVDQVFVSKADTSRSVGYANGQIFINTNASNTSTESFVDGVADNPVSTLAAAKTLSTNLGLGDFHVINGSSITLAETSDNESYFGDNYSLVLGGQSCADIHIEGAAITGAGTAATGEMHFEGCSFGTASVQSGHFDFTRFSDTVTFTLAGNYQAHNCYSGVAGPLGPTFAFAAVAITAEWRNWSGSIKFSGLTSDDTLTVGGRLGTVDLGSPASAVVVEIRGTYKEITNVGSAVVDTDGAIKGVDVASTLADTNELQTDDVPGLIAALNNLTAAEVWDRIISMANHNIGQSAGKILRQSGDLVQIDGAISDATPTTTGFDTNLTQADGYWNDAVLIFTNGSANAGKGGAILSYVNANGAVTFDADDAWAVTPVNGDDFVLFANHVHPVAEIADAVLDEVNTGATHNVVNSLGRQIRETRETNVYADNRIWIDTVNGAAGTTDFENGTLDNPVNSIADANTLAASLGKSRFMVLNGSSITFAAAQTSQNFLGDNWTLALGGQSIVGTKITGATVSGIAAGTGTLQIFEGCRMGAVSYIKGTHILACSLSGAQTLVEAGDIFFDQCYSAVAGMGTVTFDFGAALNSSNLNVRHHSGGWAIANMGAGTGTYQASFEGDGQIIWAASCSATSNASVRGAWRITDNASGAVTVTLDDTSQDASDILDDTNELQTDDVPGLIAALNNITAAAVLAAGDIDGFSLEESHKVILASQAGKDSGAATTTMTIRAADDSKDRITATVDADGNRSAVTIDATG